MSSLAKRLSDLKTSNQYQLIETHTSQVFLDAQEVYKIKKPVNYGFLDYSTIDLRYQACRAEVELNRRLAPEVYLGVVPVLDDQNKVIDYAVHMVHLSDELRFDHRIKRHQINAIQIENLAQYLAHFHSQMPSESNMNQYGEPRWVEKNIQENFDQMRQDAKSYFDLLDFKKLEEHQKQFIKNHPSLFRSRIQNHKIRDGHGDLRLEHVYLTPENHFLILDCIEFNDRFRFEDVCCDLAFLSMDLKFHQRYDLSEVLLASYARESNDYELYSLIQFYESYRALVRCKVNLFLAKDVQASPQVRHWADSQARGLFQLASDIIQKPSRNPPVILVTGLIASGKSTLAHHLGLQIHVPVIEADRTRKQILGVSATQPLPHAFRTGAYHPQMTKKVYSEMLKKTLMVLESRRTVIVDASFHSRELRALFLETLQKRQVPVYFLECRPPISTCLDRLKEREKTKTTSDGRLEIFHDFFNHYESIQGIAPDHHLIVDTSRPINENLANLKRFLSPANIQMAS